MARRITDPAPAEQIQRELKELIEHSKGFSRRLMEVLRDQDIDIAGERKATVETLQIILQKWVVEIIHVLFIYGPLRFNELKRNLEGISSRTLASKLRILEDAGFIKRELINQRPSITEYRLSEKGTVLAELSCPIILYLKLEGLKRE